MNDLTTRPYVRRGPNPPGRPPGRLNSADAKRNERAARCLELHALRERIRHLRRRIDDGSLGWTPRLEREALALAMRCHDLYRAIERRRPQNAVRRG